MIGLKITPVARKMMARRFIRGGTQWQSEFEAYEKDLFYSPLVHSSFCFGVRTIQIAGDRKSVLGSTSDVESALEGLLQRRQLSDNFLE